MYATIKLHVPKSCVPNGTIQSLTDLFVQSEVTIYSLST